jgi:hypothetical protein
MPVAELAALVIPGSSSLTGVCLPRPQSMCVAEHSAAAAD